MHQYLSDHPQIYMSSLKEPHYFAIDLPGYRTVTQESEYLENFRFVRHETVVGESSVHYLYSSEAIPRIIEYNRSVRLLIMVRNPLQMLQSYHLQMVRSRNEQYDDFNVAWKSSSKRKKGLDIPVLCKDQKVLYYDQVAKYGAMLTRVLKIVPKSQVKVVFFEDLQSDAERVYNSVLNFLDVELDGRNTFQIVNRGKAIRWETLANFTERPPRWAKCPWLRMPERYRPVSRRIKRAIGIRRVGLVPLLRWINQVEPTTQVLSAETKQAIQDEYREDILVLSEMTNRNLDHWLWCGPAASSGPGYTELRVQSEARCQEEY